MTPAYVQRCVNLAGLAKWRRCFAGDHITGDHARKQEIERRHHGKMQLDRCIINNKASFTTSLVLNADQRLI